MSDGSIAHGHTRCSHQMIL